MSSDDHDHDHDAADHEHSPIDLARYEGITGHAVREVSRTERELLGVVPVERFEAIMGEAAKDIARRVTLKGFRPGKAPASHVRKVFGDDVKRRAVERMLDEVWRAAREAHALRPIADPVLTEMSLEPGQPVRFAARFEILPEIDLQGLDEVRPKDKVVEVTDEHVEEQLAELRQARGQLVASDRDEVAPGDFVVIDLERWPTGGDRSQAASEKRDGLVVQVGNEANMPELDRVLLGMRTGESRDFVAKGPTGGEIPCRVALRALREQRLPDLDDALAKELAGFDTLAALREDLKQRLRAARRDRARHEQDAEIVEQLLARNPVEVPKTLVEQEAEARLRRGLEDMARRGIDVKTIQVDWKTEFERVRAGAERDLRADWLLELVAREKRVEVTEADVDEELLDLARRSRVSPDAVRAQVRKSNQLPAIRASVRRRRVLDLLRSGATISEK